MFKDRLNLIMDELEANNQDVANLAGIDRTNITRFRSGKRTAKYGSEMSRKLIRGLYRYAYKEKRTDVLEKITGCSTAGSEDKAVEEISRWMFEGMTNEAGLSVPSKRDIAARSFGERLNAAITLSELSNVRLSQLINTDASLISRYRSGLRMPRVNSEMIVPLEQVLWKHIHKKGKVDELARAMKCDKEDLNEEAFFKWLFDYSMYKDVNISAAERLLDIFESYSAETGLKLPDVDPILNGPEIKDRSDVYFGNEGLRSAVIRFLAGVVKDSAQELWLYSEEDMSWMIGDETFRMKWAVLMSECVRRGTKIRIIHNIDRKLDEMIGAIESWLPLYMSGMIEPYYCTRIKDSRFLHTIFLCPGKYCIEACNVPGTGNEGIYNFYDDEPRLKMYRYAYDKLLENSKPLLRFNVTDNNGSDESDLLPMQSTIVGNMKIRCNNEFVNITNVKRPQLSFCFTHPLMCRAFMVYLESIRNQYGTDEGYPGRIYNE